MPRTLSTQAVQQRLWEAMDEAIQRAISAASQEMHQACSNHKFAIKPSEVLDLMKKYVAPAVAEDAMRTYYKIITESEAQ